MDTATVVNHQTYPAHMRCLNCGGPLWTDDAWEVLGVAPVCGQCAGTCSKPKDRRQCEPCDNCGSPTPFNRFPDGMTGHICVPCYAGRRPHSPAQSPGASHAPASATASASPAGAAAGDSRPWYDRPLLTVGLPIGVASLLLIAAAVDRVVDSGAPWHEVGEILQAMAPVLATFGIILALAIGWMLRGLQLHLRAEATGGPDADSQPLARNHNR